MEDDAHSDAPPEKSGGNAAAHPDRDDKGHFLEGHEVGKETRWTPETAPKSKGRPARKHLTDALLRHLNEKASTRPFTEKAAKKLGLDPEEATGFDVLVMMALGHAMKGKGDILKQIWERVEGAVPKSMTLDFDDPVQVYIDSMLEATQPPQPESKGGEDDGDATSPDSPPPSLKKDGTDGEREDGEDGIPPDADRSPRDLA